MMIEDFGRRLIMEIGRRVEVDIIVRLRDMRVKVRDGG